jgi:hypothetical protein
MIKTRKEKGKTPGYERVVRKEISTRNQMRSLMRSQLCREEQLRKNSMDRTYG